LTRNRHTHTQWRAGTRRSSLFLKTEACGLGRPEERRGWGGRGTDF
jgi:hypothetical protein